MSVTVRDILQVETLSGAAVIAGAQGLDRQVRRVGFSDVPLNPAQDQMLCKEGDLYLRSFYTEKESDQERYILEIIEYYIYTKSAGCITVKDFYREFPQSAIDLANQNGYPIIVLPEIVAYANLIKDISECIIFSNYRWNLELNSIGLLLHNTLPDTQVVELYHKLVPLGYTSFFVAYVPIAGLNQTQIRLLTQSLLLQYRSTFLWYSSHGFIVMPYYGDKDRDVLLQQVQKMLSFYLERCTLGVSGVCTPQKFASGLDQALSAYEIGGSLSTPVTFYSELSMYKPVMLLKKSHMDELLDFCQETLSPLEEYEAAENVDLLNTVAVYIECDGNVKQASSILHQHENTVRFRISKAQSLLTLSNNRFLFIEKVSFALRARKLLQ